MFNHFFRFIVRVFARRSASYSLNILGLTLGFFASVAALYLILSEFGYNASFPNSKQIFRVLTYAIDWKAPTAKTPYNLAPEISTSCPEIKGYTRTTNLEVEMKIDVNEPFKQNILFVDTSYFNMFGTRIIVGNPNNIFLNKNAILLSKSFAKKHFGKINPIGQIVPITWFKYSIKLIVAGIVEDCNKKSTIQYDILGNLILAREYSQNAEIDIGKSNGNGWLDMRYQTFIKVLKDTKIDTFEKKMNIAGLKNYPNYFSISFLLQPIRDIYLSSKEIIEDPAPHGNKSLVLVFSLVGFIILFISCFNYIVLSTSQASLRLREFGIRKTFGASNKNIIIQTIVEYILFSVLAILISLVMFEVSFPTLKGWLNSNMEFSLFTSPLFILGLLLIVALTSILSTLYVNLFIIKVNPISSITGQTNSIGKKIPSRHILTGIQLIVFCVIFNGLLTITNQIKFLKEQDNGLNPKNLIVVSNPIIGKERDKFQIFKSKLLTETSISSVTAVSDPTLPSTELNYFPIKVVTEKNENAEVFCDMFFVEYDFLKTFGIPLISGRDLTYNNFPVYNESCLITKSAAEAFHLNEPIGKTITILDGEMNVNIVGVVENFYVSSLYKKPNPTVLILYQGFTAYYVRLNNNANIEKSLNSIKNAWKEAFPTTDFKYSFYEDEYKRLYGKTETTAKIAIVFSLCALILSVISLYAMSSHISNLKRREMSIRQVFGATTSENFKTMAKSFIIMLLLCNVVAMPISIVIANHWLQQFYFHVKVSGLSILLTFSISLLVLIIAIGGNILKTINLPVVEVLKEK